MKEEKGNFAYLAIVAIVAIVALVVLIGGSGKKQMAMPSDGNYQVVNLPVDENGNPILPVDESGNVAGMGAGKVTQIEPFIIIAYDD